MQFLYLLGLIPAYLAYRFARKQFRVLRRRHRLSLALRSHFMPQVVGWGILTVMLWFFLVAFWAQLSDPQRLTWLFLCPVAFALGELVGVFMWHREIHNRSHLRILTRVSFLQGTGRD